MDVLCCVNESLNARSEEEQRHVGKIQNLFESLCSVKGK
jgi:hypothetical protein